MNVSWLLNLYETYERNVHQVGKFEKKRNDQEFTLLPVSHTTQNAHIEVQVTEDGEFHSARAVEKEDANTLIPCTEDSASRAGSKNAPYPLHDKLVYVAGDFHAFTGIDNEENFARYIGQLQEWAESPFASDKVKSIYRYLKRGCLIRDLVDRKILVAEHGRLVSKWDKSLDEKFGAKPEVYSVVNGGVESAFVRFDVHYPGKQTPKIWQDPEVYESFIRFYDQKLGDLDFCYVKGEWLPSTQRHANKIRNAADKAKLISSNDTSGFTYRGRFDKANDAASISYEASQKAHNALKWLINRQGKFVGDRVFLVWGNQETEVPDPLDDLLAILPQAAEVTEQKAFTNDWFAREVAKAMDGYRGDLSTKANVNIMVLDSATTGRLAILYYRNMEKELYLDRLIQWHTTCVWLHNYRKNNDKFVSFLGAPATRDIAYAAYGHNVDDKIVKGLMERMLPCILDARSIPRDIVDSVYRRASNPVSMDNWEWEKTLSIACALINKSRKERLEVALDESLNDRDYLFGRLLAVADVLERNALGQEETRATNAIRYMNAFSKHPARTWKVIQEALQPYQARLGTRATYWTKIIDEVASRIPIDQFNDKPLSGLYLLGFYSQRHELYKKKTD